MESTKATNNAVITDPYVMDRTKGRKGYMENILTTENTEKRFSGANKFQFIIHNYMKYILTTEDTENTEKSPANIIAGNEQLKANKIHFQLSTFN
jgi:hypothetical protein